MDPQITPVLGFEGLHGRIDNTDSIYSKASSNSNMSLIPRPVESLPVTVRLMFRQLRQWIRTLWHSRTGTPLRSPIPESLVFVGSGDFEKIGLEFRNHLVQYTQLKPHHRVLDIGCGQGRIALPLCSFLSEAGEYQGFDVTRSSIWWCQRNISARFPNFQFQHASVFNRNYNPLGRHKAYEFRFPYEDAYFDRAIVTSVFTHMEWRDVCHYLNEISRVLRPGGLFLATFFFVNRESTRLMSEDQSSLDFTPHGSEQYVVDPSIPEAAIAFPEQAVHEQLTQCNLELIKPVHYGAWCGREAFLSFQDMIIAQKTREHSTPDNLS